MAPPARRPAARRILIVDDDASIRFLLRLIFENAGYRVFEAQHGRAALIRMRIRLPDVVLTDIKMPVMDGEALIEHLRSDPMLADLPIVVVTGNGEARTVADKVDAVLHKPFHHSALVATINGLLQQRELKAG